MFIPALEFRRFCQGSRTDAEKKEKLVRLAYEWLKKKDCVFPKNTAIEVVVADICESYLNGLDIPDPEDFYKEDIVSFAEENGVVNDPQVVEFISRARTAEEWGYV